METFKQRMKRIRLRAGFRSQGDAAAAIGCERGTVGMWEAPSSNVQAVSSEWLFAAARAYRVRPDWINALGDPADGYPWSPADPSATGVTEQGAVSGPHRSITGTVSTGSESVPVRLDPAMLAEAEKLAEIAAAIGRTEHTRLQKMELVAALYPKLLANGGELTREDYQEFIRAAEAQRPNTGSTDDRSATERTARRSP